MPKERRDKMQKRIDKKTVIIVVFLILAMVISVFAIYGVIQTNKVTANGDIAPYTYKLILAYFGYWKDGDTYYADIHNQNGQVIRKDIGSDPSQYMEWDYWFPVATISGNYAIEDIMNYMDYKGTWEELNYNVLPEREVNDYYMNTAKIENEEAVIGATNTTVKFQASFRPLPTDKAKKEGDVYKCYIAIVIRYKNLDYVEPPEEPEEPEEPDPGDGNVMVYVYHKEKGTEKTLATMQKVRTSMGSNLVLSNLDIDGYKCGSSTMKGLVEKNFSQNYIDVKIGQFDYSTPDNTGYEYVTFWYEEYEEPEKPTCDPQFNADADDARITMKRKNFENATDIYFNNVRIAVDDFEGGHKQISGTEWGEVEGEHNFESFDIYLKYSGSSAYDYTRYDIFSQTANISLNVPADKFTPTNEAKTEYVANVNVLLGVLCSCGGFNAENTTLRLYVDIVENQPPVAYYRHATKKTLPNGTESREYGKVYIGKDVVVDNYCDDPNGLTDIDYVRYVFRNQNNSEQIKSIQIKMMPWGAYELDEADSFGDTSIIFKDVEVNGSLNLQFTTDEEWEVTILVRDTEGLNDTYTDIIKPEVLTLKPTAVIKDTSSYRYPSITDQFNGKQNRVIEFNSNSSYIASWLQDFGNIIVDHSKDMWRIEALDGQDITSVKFERDINKSTSSHVLNARYEPLDTKMMFKEPGRYKISLQVTDTEGNTSDWADQIITIHDDLPPTITANVNPKYYRNSSKIAAIKFNALAASNDDDFIEITNIGYKFDSNNNGIFTDEILQTANLSHKDVNINGVLYKEITLTNSKVGKYQFIINVMEDFKQETIEKYITNEDYKTANAILTTEIDNISPVGTLGLEKNNNIDVKILTTGLTGTRQVDVENNLNNLKVSLESQNNIKVGDIEVLKLANERNGLLSENSLTWRKVAMNGYADDYNFEHEEIKNVTDTGNNPATDPNKPLVGFWYNVLPNSVYADGWNGIEVPSLYIASDIGTVNINNLVYKDTNTYWDKDYNRYNYVQRDYFMLNYTSNIANIYTPGYSIWDGPISDVSYFSAITKEKLSDFDIDFDISISPKKYGEDSMGDSVFLFNVQDKNNYFAYSQKDRSNYVLGGVIAEIVQVKNGVTKVLKQFYYTRERESGEWEYYETTVTRFRQVGNLLQAYYGDMLVFETNINNVDTGGYLGISAKDGYTSSDVRLNINALTYIENSSMYEAIEKLDWKDGADKYIINLVENNKLNELTNNTQLNKTAGLLQTKEINLINVGVNSVNGAKLKELTTKNLNNGTYLELSNVYDNLNAAASYIRNRYSGSNTISQYLLLGSKISYKENYSDNENDPLFSKAFRYYHLPNYFENSLGTISNNNSWIDSTIETFNKTGKYALNYRVQDNPLFPDLNLLSPFNNYRKYGNIFAQDIYVHRKPIANFNMENFSSSAYIENSIIEDFSDTVYTIQPSGGYFNYGNWEIKSPKSTQIIAATFNLNVPSNAINVKLSMNVSKYQGTGYANVVIPNIGINDIFYSNANPIYSLQTGNTTVQVVSRATKGTSSLTILLDNIQLSYSIPNDNATVTITESSYDIDHKSQSNKGISEWQWKLIDKDGITTTQSFTSRASGITWVQNSLKNAKWFNATVVLRVKDLEGAWSDWNSKYIDGEAIRDGWYPELNETIPIADFLIDKDPLIINSESQIITDTSYDPGGSALNYIWTVRKGNNTLFTSTQDDISSTLNSHILNNGIGIYEISLMVSNSSGIYSNIVTKSFNVIVFNYPPSIDFDLVSNEIPAWVFPKILGLHTLRYRPTASFFYEEKTKFNVNVTDPNTDNTGFIYDWKLERFAVKNINNISGAAANTYSYTTQYPFTNSFKGQGLPWGAYRITLSVTDKPPVPPYASGDAKTAIATKQYYIVPELSLTGSFESASTEIMVGDTITLKAKTSKETENVICILEGTTFTLNKDSEDSGFAYWEKNITIPESITESGKYQLQFVGNTTYGGNGSITREFRDTVSLDIVALKLINFRITGIVNHPHISFPQTKNMLETELIPYKAGYYVTLRIDSKGKPENVYGRIDINNDGSIDQVVNMTKVVTGDIETWQGRFYTSSTLTANTVISIKLDCNKGTTVYDYNLIESWGGRSLITNGSALMDGRVNLTN